MEKMPRQKFFAAVRAHPAMSRRRGLIEIRGAKGTSGREMWQNSRTIFDWEQAWRDRLQTPAGLLANKATILLCLGKRARRRRALPAPNPPMASKRQSPCCKMPKTDEARRNPDSNFIRNAPRGQAYVHPTQKACDVGGGSSIGPNLPQTTRRTPPISLRQAENLDRYSPSKMSPEGENRLLLAAQGNYPHSSTGSIRPYWPSLRR